jgi:hypothetical protein
MTDQDHLVRRALCYLRDSDNYRQDAETGAPLGNSVIGSLLSLIYKAPRWATEQAVLEALTQLKRERKRGRR